MIKNIETYKIKSHPKNPRVDLGDLKDLSNSIQAQGIMQPLTVVETDTHEVFTVIIGHRRLAAAEKAGLVTVPCIVKKLSDADQLSIMLLENIERQDLTPFEQAKGIQQCLDFGMSEEDISAKTGFSKAKVRRRVKLLDLDQKKLKQSTNTTIDDFFKLEEVKDVNKRNKLIDFIGTNNFGFELEKQLSKQNKPKQEINASKNEEVVIESSKDTETLQVAYKLRTQFIESVFKRKIAPSETAVAVGIVVNSFVNDQQGNKHLFLELVNPKNLEHQKLSERINNNKTNHLVVHAYSILESFEDKTHVYKYLVELGYELSDYEMEALENVENRS